MDCKNMGFATRQIHAGKHDNGVGALCTPIYQTSTFEFDTVQQGGARFAGQEEGYIYSRLGNPSLTQVEEKLAALEGGEAALATASGMGAISSALWSSVEAGDEIVASDTLYGCTFALLNHGMSKFGVSVKFVDFADLAAVKAALTEKTKVVYLETPCNPTLRWLTSLRLPRSLTSTTRTSALSWITPSALLTSSSPCPWAPMWLSTALPSTSTATAT